MNRFNTFKTAAWHNMRRRTKTRRSYLSKGIEIRMTKQELYNWLDAHQDKIESIWKTGDLASINRKNHLGHYEINNIEIQSFTENTLEAGPRREQAKFKQITIITPREQEFTFDSIKAAARAFNLRPGSLADVYRGDREQLFGFRVRKG